MKLKFTSIVLLVIFLLLSCSDNAGINISDTSNSDTVIEEQSAEEIILKPKLPEIDFNNEKFIILNGNVQEWMTISTIYAEEETGDSLNDAIFKRNRAVEEQFNIELVEITTSSVKADATKSITAGDNSFEFVLLTMGDAFAMTLENLAVAYEDIPYISVYNHSEDGAILSDCPWWVMNSITDMSIANRVYFGISLFDTTHYDGVRTLFFNKQMITDFNLDSPYDLVNSGKWTIESMKTMGMTVAADVNGDGIDDEGDRYGYTSWQSISGQSLMAGVDAPLSIAKDNNDLPVFNLDGEHFISRYEAIVSLLNDNKGFKNPIGVAANHGGVTQFTAGNVLFYNETMSNTKNLRSMDTDFGIIPMPKYNESQNGYKMVAGNPYFTLVPVTNNNLERLGIIMESLAYESMDTVSIAFYDILLMGKIVRDNDSEQMLDIIFNSLSFYHPIATKYVNSNITNMLDINDRDIVSYFAANKSAIEKEIETALNVFLE